MYILSPAPLHTHKGSQFTQQNSVPTKALTPNLCSRDAAILANVSCLYTPLRGLEMFCALWREHTSTHTYLNTGCLWFFFKTQPDAQLLREAFPDHPIWCYFFSVSSPPLSVHSQPLVTMRAFDNLSFSTYFRLLKAMSHVSVVNLCLPNKGDHTWPTGGSLWYVQSNVFTQ